MNLDQLRKFVLTVFKDAGFAVNASRPLLDEGQLSCEPTRIIQFHKKKNQQRWISCQTLLFPGANPANDPAGMLFSETFLACAASAGDIRSPVMRILTESCENERFIVLFDGESELEPDAAIEKALLVSAGKGSNKAVRLNFFSGREEGVVSRSGKPFLTLGFEDGSVFMKLSLELFLALSEGVPGPYDTTAFRAVITYLEDLCEIDYGFYAEKDRAFRTVADISRTLAFAIRDGIQPDNRPGGRWLRDGIVNAIWLGETLNLYKPFLFKLVPVAIGAMKGGYPELSQRREEISRIVKIEEEKLRQVSGAVERELRILCEKTGSGGIIPVEKSLELYSSLGAPISLQKIIAEKLGLGVDTENFERLAYRDEPSPVRMSCEDLPETGRTEAASKTVQQSLIPGSPESVALKNKALDKILAILKKRLGEHVKESSRRIEENKFRLDFTHYEALGEEVLHDIERELHEEFPFLIITAESSVGTDMRRLEVRTGEEAFEFLSKAFRASRVAARKFSCPVENLGEISERLLETIKQERMKNLTLIAILGEIIDIFRAARKLPGGYLVSGRIEGLDMEMLRRIALEILKKLEKGVCLLGTTHGGRASIVALASGELVSKGFDMSELVESLAPVLGGRGGGSPALAVAGSRFPERLGQTLEDGVRILEELLGGEQ